MINISFVEKLYDNILRTVFVLANPIKKSIKKTECIVHIFLNNQALEILEAAKYFSEYNFYSKYINYINDGAVWADQDFKSSNHFYHPYKKKGLFGRRNAMILGTDYYNKALKLWNTGKREKSMFYLGAALHIVQDMTVPQHANIKLLDNHHQYEKYVKISYNNIQGHTRKQNPYLLDTIENFIRFNARIALKIDKRYRRIHEDNERFLRISNCSLPLAKRTTAGAMVLFFNTINPK